MAEEWEGGGMSPTQILLHIPGGEMSVMQNLIIRSNRNTFPLTNFASLSDSDLLIPLGLESLNSLITFVTGFWKLVIIQVRMINKIIVRSPSNFHGCSCHCREGNEIKTEVYVGWPWLNRLEGETCICFVVTIPNRCQTSGFFWRPTKWDFKDGEDNLIRNLLT